MDKAHEGPVKVTVTDPKTGEVLQEKILENDFVVITAGNRYVKHIQYMGRTCVFSVAVKK